MIKRLSELLENVANNPKLKLAVAAAEDEDVLGALKQASMDNIVEPILIGDKKAIIEICEKLDYKINHDEIIETTSLEESAKKAVELVVEKKAHFLMKGLLDTSILLKAVLNKETGLRTENLISHVMLYDVPSYHKLLILTDGGMNIAPSVKEKAMIIKNAHEVAKSLGIETTKVAVIAAKEKPNEKMPATMDARELQDMCNNNEFGDGIIVEGPLAVDLALSSEAAKVKNFKSEISGDVDIIAVPFIEVGNALGKSLTYLAGATSAGIIMGAKVPIVLVSRADDFETKLYSIALGSHIASKCK